MARHRRTSSYRSSTARRSLVAGATVVVTGLGAGVVGITTSHAAPRPTIASVKAGLTKLNDRMDRAVEAYDRAKVDLAQARRRADLADRRVQAAEQRLTKARADLALLASAAYRGVNGADGVLNSFMAASNPQQFADRTSTLDELGRNRVATLHAVTAAEHDLSVARQAAADELAKARDLADRMADRKAYIQKVIHDQRHLLGRLEAKDRARFAAEQRADAAHQAGLGAAAAAGQLPAYAGPASGRAAVAVQWAYRELGKPYVWGAAGPDAFDCSGLTMYVWGQAGVSLPHSSGAQYGAGVPVSQSQLRPGDLVFFGSPIHHVGIYVGGGNMIDAPHTGSVVRVTTIAQSDYVGAVRP